MISPYKVTYAGYSSEDFDLICDLAFDSDVGETSSFLAREAVASETYRGAIKHVSSYKYTESFAPVLTFIDKDFGDFTVERQRQILKWLTSKDAPSFMKVYHDDSEVVSYAILGGFTSCDTYKLGNGRVVGFQCTFESCMPYALSDLQTIEKKKIDPTDNKITINIDTDDNQPVYPRITIKGKGTIIPIATGSTLNVYSDMVPNAVYYNGTTYYWKADESALVTGVAEPNYGWPKVQRDTVYANTDEIQEGTVYYYTSDQRYRWIDPYTFKTSTTDPNIATTGVKITNRHYDVLGKLLGVVDMAVKNNSATETVVVDGANKIISSSNQLRIFGDDFINWAWLPLYDGKNELTIDGNCEVIIEYRTVVKCGEY